ncbi:WD-40 repeat-containing protein MSI4 [Lactuca sativa]|uniref:WD-40 repeat-containing protein MSI4 n=1 Tax=Lactuca sativa TaxID=4236 RepID=UPI0022B0315B|nr:WD-40 repeat-containing protein MSI4 [Lactuca sativa]
MFQWSPDKSSIFGSSAEDGVLNIWDHNKVGERSGPASKFAPGLLFRHSGHRDKVVDFYWNSHDPWTIVSVSDDGESTGGGGTLQIWRMIDLIHRPQEEVINELEQLITSSLFLMLKLFPNLGFGNLIRLQWSLDFESMFHLFDKKIHVLLSFIPRFSSHLWKALDMDIQDRELVNDWLMIIVYKERGFG